MASRKALSAERNTFTEPLSESAPGYRDDGRSASKRPSRQVNVYDAVAGKHLRVVSTLQEIATDVAH